MRRDSISRRAVRRVRQERDAHPEAIITVILADRVRTRSILAPFAHRHSLAIKSRLLFEPGVVVTDLNVPVRSRRSKLPRVPTRKIEQVVLVSDMTRPIREALTYAQSLGPPVTAIHIDVDEAQRDRLERQWVEAGYELPLVVISSPYRSIVSPLVRYLRDRRRAASPGNPDLGRDPRVHRPGAGHPTSAQSDRSCHQGHPGRGSGHRSHQCPLPSPDQRRFGRLNRYPQSYSDRLSQVAITTPFELPSDTQGAQLAGGYAGDKEEHGCDDVVAVGDHELQIGLCEEEVEGKGSDDGSEDPALSTTDDGDDLDTEEQDDRDVGGTQEITQRAPRTSKR